jgi:hypothetical protein
VADLFETSPKRALAFGAGVDSTALLAAALDPGRAAGVTGSSRQEIEAAIGRLDAVVFADPGAEYQRTYQNVETARELSSAAGLEFVVVRKDGETITEAMLRLGTVPLMPGGGHVCSQKWKIGPMHRWAAGRWPGAAVTWVIGIEANEAGRAQRFTESGGDTSAFAHPMVELGWTREDALAVVAAIWPHEVSKSACVFCPFSSCSEIAEATKDPAAWDLIERIEARFAETSAIKHRRWIDAGRPLSGGKRPRAPVGMWRLDSWAKGARLFAATKNGRRLSVPEWKEQA